MEKKYDLTTQDGIKSALEDIGAKDLLLSLLLWPIGPYVLAGKKILDRNWAEISSAESTIDQQRKAAVEIIKQGKESGASCIKVTLDQKAGIDFQSDINGIPVKAMIGKTGTMTLEVEYK